MSLCPLQLWAWYPAPQWHMGTRTWSLETGSLVAKTRSGSRGTLETCWDEGVRFAFLGAARGEETHGVPTVEASPCVPLITYSGTLMEGEDSTFCKCSPWKAACQKVQTKVSLEVKEISETWNLCYCFCCHPQFTKRSLSFSSSILILSHSHHPFMQGTQHPWIDVVHC